jgi:hypothetical protein
MTTVEDIKVTSSSAPMFDLPSLATYAGTEETSDQAVDLATTRIRHLNERLIKSTKGAGLVTLGASENTLQSLVQFEKKVASATQLDWVSALATTHAKFITDISANYTKAARDLLK